MSKVVILCMRKRECKQILRHDFDALSARLMPDNISANPPLVIEQDGVTVGILNPSPSLLIRNTSVCAGHLIEPSPNWWVPLSPIPDGAYALFRSDDQRVEIATDVLASRTIWYAHTDTMFIASTSQRAILFFLQSYNLNERTMVWMLASGNLGLGNSWDREIKYLLPDSRLSLNRDSWKVTVEQGEIDSYLNNQTDQEYERDLRDALEYSFSGLSLDFSKWALALSGGVDSRENLLKLKSHKDLKCIIWGTGSALSKKYSDACIAKRLSDYFGLAHHFFNLDRSNESIEKILDRFISLGEGRTDNIYLSLDGFNIWKSLFESGVYGIIKGDEVLGCASVIDDIQARQRQDIFRLQDYNDMRVPKEMIEKYFSNQVWENWLERKGEESLDSYCYRLYQGFQAPVGFAAWNEPRYSYIEVVNPLISRSIVRTVRTLPDHLRTDKALFRKIVDAESPKIPYAKQGIEDVNLRILYSPEAVELFRDTFSSSYFRVLFPTDLLDHIVCELKLSENAARAYKPLVRQVSHMLPNIIKTRLMRQFFKLKLGYNRLALRFFIVGNVNKMFHEDATNLAKHRQMDYRGLE